MSVNSQFQLDLYEVASELAFIGLNNRKGHFGAYYCASRRIRARVSLAK